MLIMPTTTSNQVREAWAVYNITRLPRLTPDGTLEAPAVTLRREAGRGLMVDLGLLAAVMAGGASIAGWAIHELPWQGPVWVAVWVAGAIIAVSLPVQWVRYAPDPGQDPFLPLLDPDVQARMCTYLANPARYPAVDRKAALGVWQQWLRTATSYHLTEVSGTLTEFDDESLQDATDALAAVFPTS